MYIYTYIYIYIYIHILFIYYSYIIYITYMPGSKNNETSFLRQISSSSVTTYSCIIT